VRLHTSLPPSSIVDTVISTHKTFLDTVGRTAVTIRARNLVDEFRDREVVVLYRLPLAASLRKPAVIFASAFAVFVAWSIISRVEFKFWSKATR